MRGPLPAAPSPADSVATAPDSAATAAARRGRASARDGRGGPDPGSRLRPPACDGGEDPAARDGEGLQGLLATRGDPRPHGGAAGGRCGADPVVGWRARERRPCPSRLRRYGRGLPGGLHGGGSPAAPDPVASPAAPRRLPVQINRPRGPGVRGRVPARVDAGGGRGADPAAPRLLSSANAIPVGVAMDTACIATPTRSPSSTTMTSAASRSAPPDASAPSAPTPAPWSSTSATPSWRSPTSATGAACTRPSSTSAYRTARWPSSSARR